MRATENEIDILIKIQEIDTQTIRNTKKLDELPQKHQILEVRTKLAEIVKKKTQVQDMIDAADEEMAALMAEDERLAKKQQDTQDALDRVKGDYRSVESYTKDMHGMAKRREKIAGDMERVDEQLERIKPIMAQIMDGCTKLEAREKELIASYQAEGGALQKAIAENNAARKNYCESLDAEVLRAYERASHECGGIGIAELVDSSCSACRSAFDQNKLLKIKQEEPLSRCPVCRRLLIVRD